ncbi:TetR/AcrR family transcriptional regulator [Arachnia propionica]|uniref:TetR/AcrR family transcriptional regulator n=2 Tax=Arachnia propionica TaxID=1750 RepID=A0A3P1T3H8_9ACTN|nr:TetR/AcrR family transcriptional regulator [Arachnia propionica]
MQWCMQPGFADYHVAMTELTPRREATVARLIEAAIEQFAARGIDATSVEQICEAAGFSRGAFYSNFASKDDLCAAMIHQFQDRLLTELSTMVAEIPTNAETSEQLALVLDKIAAVISPTPQMTLTLLEIRLRAHRNPELYQRLVEADERTLPQQIAFIEHLISSLGIELILPTDQVLRIFEALFFYDAHCDPNADSRQVMAPLALALVRQPEP